MKYTRLKRVSLSSLKNEFSLMIYSLYASGMSVIHKTFLKFHSKTVSQHSPEQLK